MIRHQSNAGTGPKTTEGNAISCMNNRSADSLSLPVVRVQGVKHGLTGSFCVLKSESQEVFNELRDALREEHAPATPTEILLVDRLAEHAWLSQRAQRMQDEAACEGEDHWFSIMLRYQTTHDRAFHKCLVELRAVRRERHQQSERARQFESQNAEAVAKTRLLHARAAQVEQKTNRWSRVAAPHASSAQIPFAETQKPDTAARAKWTDPREGEREKAAA